MAATKILRIQDSNLKIRSVFGAALIWGHTLDSNGPQTGDAQNKTIDAADISSGSGWHAQNGENVALNLDITNADFGFDVTTRMMGRAIFELDLTSLPLNAVISSAALSMKFAQMMSETAPATGFFPVTFSLYRLLRAADINAASLQFYSGTLPWAAWGVQKDVDYRAVPESSLVISDAQRNTINATSLNAGQVAYTFDITAAVQFASDSDSRKLLLLFTRSNAHRASFPTLLPNPSAGGNNTIRMLGGLTNALANNPTVTIVHIDPLTHHPADDTGAIDTTVFVDTTAAGIWFFSSIAVGAQGTAEKFFVKNNLNSEAKDLKLLSQTSHGSMVWEVDRTLAIGAGVLTDIATTDKSVEAVNYTRTERWKIEFESGDYALGQYHVYRDNGTFDDPTQTDVWSAATPAIGSLGSQYTETTRGVSFTLTDGSPIFQDGDLIAFRTFEDDAQDQAPSDSDKFLEIAPDVNNTPGTFQKLLIKRVLVTAAVASDVVVPVSDASRFSVGAQVRFYNRTTGAEQTRTIDSVNEGTNEIGVNSAITLAQDDYAEMVPLGTATIGAQQTFPYWLKPVSPAGSSRETKFPRWRAIAD